MARSEGLVHRKLPPDAEIHTRQPVQARTEDEETEAREFEELGLGDLRAQLANIARAADNRASPVDEYNSAAISGAGSSVAVNVLPTYELTPEKIEAIIVTGVPGNITLILGDRTWALTIPPTGILVIAPVAILLNRTDQRQLIPAAAGVFTLELMGIADRRFAT